MTHLELEAKRTELLETARELARLLDGAQRSGDRVAVEALALATTTLVQLAVCPVLHVMLDEALEEPSAREHDS